MMNILKTLAVALTLATGIVAASGLALAGPDVTYHWAYPDGFKGNPNVPQQPFGAESGIPPLYR